jgi:hypothetical protein
MEPADRFPADPDLAWRLLLSGAPMRVGRRVGRTLYLTLGGEASEEDLLVGVMDSPELAEYVAEAVNRRRSR